MRTRINTKFTVLWPVLGHNACPGSTEAETSRTQRPRTTLCQPMAPKVKAHLPRNALSSPSKSNPRDVTRHHWCPLSPALHPGWHQPRPCSGLQSPCPALTRDTEPLLRSPGLGTSAARASGLQAHAQSVSAGRNVFIEMLAWTGDIWGWAHLGGTGSDHEEWLPGTAEPCQLADQSQPPSQGRDQSWGCSHRGP